MHIVIIGNGISGATAAKTLRKHSAHKITMVSYESDNFFSRTALMYVFMGHMRMKDLEPHPLSFWEGNNIYLLNNYVSSIDFDGKRIEFIDHSTLEYDKLIIATGSKTKKYGWPGQDLDGVHGLYHLQDLEALERHSESMEQAVIVGGGLIGVELAEMLHSRNIPIIFLVRESQYWRNVLPEEEAQMVSDHIIDHGIDLRFETELKEIWGDESGKVKMIVTSKGEKIKCSYVGISTGVTPNISFLDFSAIETDKGILVDQYLNTSISDVYAVGDCAQLRKANRDRKSIEAVWYTGRMMGQIAALNILGQKQTAYNPGIWFNSAKFFDIEYQTYGKIPEVSNKYFTHLFWRHPDKNKSIRIVYSKATKAVVGFNLMGIRYRHEVCERWIKNKVTIQEVLPQLSLANFDPEFYKEYEKEIIDIYNSESGETLQKKSSRSLKKVFQFLLPS